MAAAPQPPVAVRRVPHGLVVALVLAGVGVLAVNSLVRDSVTFDETSHLTAGFSYLQTGDFRLAADHPPLAKLWCALPAWLSGTAWPDAPRGWNDLSVFGVGREWLFERNAPAALIVPARLMMVVLLLVTCATTWFAARTCFGPTGGLVALVVAGLSPTLLAHGRLVTTDLPLTLAALLAILTYARFLARPRWPALLLAALALGGASVTKFSWPLIVPALAIMGAYHAVAQWRSAGASTPPRLNAPRRWTGAARVLVSWATLAGVCWLAIWTTYGWRRTVTPPPPAAAPPAVLAEHEAVLARLSRDWNTTFFDPLTGKRRTGLFSDVLNVAVDECLLPDAYVLGLAQTRFSTSARSAYLRGAYSDVGWASYFPYAFLIKTPIATLLLAAGGLAALLCRMRVQHRVLLIGLLAFALVYAGNAVFSHINIGHRHLLPIYPVLFVLAGASAHWWSQRIGRWLIGAALAWLAAANLWIHPHYLAYFNEFVGGPARAHRHLVDSNLDWGQDLYRLAAYARCHPDEDLKLAYFGSALPTAYVACTALPSYFAFEPPAELTAGTYVVSATQLLGVYLPGARDAFWDARARAAYAQLLDLAATPVPPDAPPEAARQHAATLAEVPSWRAQRLLSRLNHRAPDARLGWSLFVFRLSEAEVAELTRP